MKRMKVGFMQCRRWAVYLIVLMIISMNLVLSETSTLSGTASIELGRRLLQIQDTPKTTYEPDDTTRIDPLKNFNKYRGGYDITYKHYWSSAMFTGIYGYAIALLWLIAGAVYFIYLLAASCCVNKNKKLKKRIPCHKQCCLFPVILTTVMATLAIIMSGVALGGTTQFHSRAKTIMSIIIDTADQASHTINKATRAMKEISETLQTTDGVDGVADASSFLDSTSDKLDHEAAEIKQQAKRNRNLIDKGLTALYIMTTITISLNLVAVIALSVLGILRFRRILYMLIILCWLLTTLCWLFFGTYFFLETFSIDTCKALQDFRQNPDNSSLSSILPCNELLSAKSILSDVGVGIYEVVNQVNVNISLMRSSFPNLEYVCNPFSGPPDFLYQPGNCPADTIQIRDIPELLKMFTCSDTSGTSCNEGEFITISVYNVIQAYTTSIENLLNAYPEMESLVDCQLVKNAFSDILVHHCKPLKKNIKTTWISTLLLSIVMVIIIQLWISTTHHETRNHHFINGSVKPSITEADNMDPEAAIARTPHQVQ